VARQTHPDRGIAYSADSHYTHARMCGVLGVEGHSVPVDARGRMDLDALERQLRTGKIGTDVLTAGTTGLGAIDPIDDALPLAERYGVRLHGRRRLRGLLQPPRARRCGGHSIRSVAGDRAL